MTKMQTSVMQWQVPLSVTIACLLVLISGLSQSLAGQHHSRPVVWFLQAARSVQAVRVENSSQSLLVIHHGRHCVVTLEA